MKSASRSSRRLAGEEKMHAAEEFWEELLAHIDAGDVIPVVGPALLAVDSNGRDVPLYECVGQRLLEKYSVTAPVPRPFHELNDAVYALLASRDGRRVQDLYR